MKVEVDLDDLTTLIFATAVIKSIESALANRKQDPFVRPHLDFTQAHNNLVAAMNAATRSADDQNTKVSWDRALSDKEVSMLQKFEQIPVFQIDGDYRRKHSEIDALAAKGCVRLGQLVSGAVWPGEDRADIKPVEGFAVAITKRGIEKLAGSKLPPQKELKV